MRLKRRAGELRIRSDGSRAPKFTLGPVSFDAQQSEMVAILGPNASGKSTLLKLLAGLTKPLSGHIEVDGFEVSELDLRDARAKNRARSAGKRVAVSASRLGIRFAGTISARAAVAIRIGRRLRAVRERSCAGGRERDFATAGWTQLSGGEKQRVILARALAQQPSLLLLDEPTQHLDIGGKVELLRRLAATGGREPVYGGDRDARTESCGGIFRPYRAAARAASATRVGAPPRFMTAKFTGGKYLRRRWRLRTEGQGAPARDFARERIRRLRSSESIF